MKMKKITLLFGIAMLIASMFATSVGSASASNKSLDPIPCSTCGTTGNLSLRVLVNSPSTQLIPINGAIVYVTSNNSGTIVAKGLTDSKGMFSATLPTGSYNLSLSAKGYDKLGKSITITAVIETKASVYMNRTKVGAVVTDPIPCLTCTPAIGKFSVTVFENKPSTHPIYIAGALVNVYSLPSINTQPIASGTTDKNGNYSVALPQGAYLVKISANGYNGSSQYMKVVANQSTKSTALLSPRIPSTR
jgi:hypothetical protein